MEAVADAPTVDYGTGFYREDGRWLPRKRIGASDGIELVDVVDIKSPDVRRTVRVARRKDPLLTILEIKLKDGRLEGTAENKALWIAADRFRNDTALAEGARGQMDNIGMPRGGSTDGAAVALVDANTRVRKAWQAIRGPENNHEVADVLRCIVLAWVTLETVQKTRRVRHGKVREALIMGLTRLEEHHAILPPPRDVE